MLSALRICVVLSLWACPGWGRGFAGTPETNPLALPQVGDCYLRLISPTVLELAVVDTKSPDKDRLLYWNWITTNAQFESPRLTEFQVTAGTQSVDVEAAGFKRRVLYAPLKPRDLRIGDFLYLQLKQPIADNETVEVKNPSGKLWAADWSFQTVANPERWSPAVHVNQVGYAPALPKKAMVGYYLGSLGELTGWKIIRDKTTVPTPSQPALPAAHSPGSFKIIAAGSGREVYRGQLSIRPDKGFPFPSYQQVWEADFSELKTPGEYRLLVPGLGASFPFFVDDGIAGAFARAYALGLYHQRCGAANALPFTRFIHLPCHTQPADIPLPQSQFGFTWKTIAQASANYAGNPRHTAPQLKDPASQRYPFQRQGKIDVSGGHHDAGDYSKYTINSAALIHTLVFAVDALPGVAALDNLGIPESGDGISDVLQEAKWEADFLARMQDDDGGFFFLVYPREREYENNVLPDHGDPQVVWPKNTAATAAAVAALAQCASSPAFQHHYPDAASAYLRQAKKGWSFLTNALDRYGRDGAYQKLTHYGDDFMHDDELAWAACEMFLATKDAACQRQLRAWLNPADPRTRKWGWWRLCQGYGCAIRSYAFAGPTGRLNPSQIDRLLLEQCEAELIAGAQEQLQRSQDSACGTSFPEETKRVRTAGWYFSLDQAFDLAVAMQLDHPRGRELRPRFLDAILSNLNYEAGGNPPNVTCLTGLGWKRQHEIVHQYAVNDRRDLPPSGIPLGNIQGGFSWLEPYKRELGAVTFPPDEAKEAPYPIYDRWGDSFNLTTEFVVLDQARGLAVTAFLMAQTPLTNQAWRAVEARIQGLPAQPRSNERAILSLSVPGLDPDTARIVWEVNGQESSLGPRRTFTPGKPGSSWIEAEAQWPDGRRMFAVTHFIVAP